VRVLFDENLNRRLRRFFTEGFEVITTAERGWNGKGNGELLELAEKEFDALLTTDKGLPHQQNLARFDLAVVLLLAESNAYEDLAPLMDRAVVALSSTDPGTVTRVPAAPR
jgi:predicted nuclease of predicted toxin-antitoxin system